VQVRGPAGELLAFDGNAEALGRNVMVSAKGAIALAAGMTVTVIAYEERTMEALYPIIRRQRRPVVNDEGQLPVADSQAESGGQMPEAGCQMPDTAPAPQAAGSLASG
jgi:hypothetical protein